MTEKERKLIVNIAKFVLSKVMNNHTEVIGYNEVAESMNLPIEIIKSAASKVCNCIMLSRSVDDTDIIDNESFCVLLKSRKVQVR